MPRGVDVILSLTATVVLLPALLVIAIANYLLTGTVLFRQVRIGRDLRPFVIFKFQTMVTGADRGPTVAVEGDNRTTSFGRVLRATKLDELPQLINVLRGDMSIVGPRALPPSEVERLPTSVAARVYRFRPGLTGLASLMLTDEGKLLAQAPDSQDFYFRVILPQKAAWELLYSERRGVGLDILILALTLPAIVFPNVMRERFSRFIGNALLARS